jgi:MoxR-like ATPase
MSSNNVLEQRAASYFPGQFQAAAVKIAARPLNKRGGVLIGDVVGLGKTLMATALARIVENDCGISTLILCPKNLRTRRLSGRWQCKCS